MINEIERRFSSDPHTPSFYLQSKLESYLAGRRFGGCERALNDYRGPKSGLVYETSDTEERSVRDVPSM